MSLTLFVFSVKVKVIELLPQLKKQSCNVKFRIGKQDRQKSLADKLLFFFLSKVLSDNQKFSKMNSRNEMMIMRSKGIKSFHNKYCSEIFSFQPCPGHIGGGRGWRSSQVKSCTKLCSGR